MKKLSYSALFLGLALSFSSCSDFLDQKSPDDVTTDNFWEDQADAEAALMSCYSQLEGFDSWTDFQESRPTINYYRNDMLKPGPDAFNYPTWMELYYFTVIPGNTSISGMWSWNYRGINYCNQVLENVPNIDGSAIDIDERKEILAEARFLRAYYHLQLLLNFDQIILQKSYAKNIDEVEKPLSTRKECWDFIVDELLLASNDLIEKQSSDNVGRATRGAANAYLGKAYLFRAAEEKGKASEYKQKAKEALKKVIDSNQYALEADFLGMFNGTRENSIESIFELQLSSVTESGANYDMQYHFFIGPQELGMYGELEGTSLLLEEMKKEGSIADGGLMDNRLYSTVFFNDPYFNDTNEPKVYGETFKEVFGKGDLNRVFPRKYLPTTKEALDDQSSINIPLMRYADVLLMYAELLNDEGNSGEAANYINQVRAVHGKMPAIKSNGQQAIREQIEHERIMEFTVEGDRFLSLRRWGLDEQRMKEAGRSYSHSSDAYFPIPENETNNNSKI